MTTTCLRYNCYLCDYDLCSECVHARLNNTNIEVGKIRVQIYYICVYEVEYAIGSFSLMNGVVLMACTLAFLECLT